MARKNEHHILSASSTLLGLCFVVLTSLRLDDKHKTSLIDEFTAVAILIFMTSTFLSYLSMRNEKVKARRYEKIADRAFLYGLIVLFVTTILVSLNVIQ